MGAGAAGGGAGGGTGIGGGAGMGAGGRTGTGTGIGAGAGGCAGITTATEATPDIDGSKTEVAITYRVVKTSLVETVSKPLAFMSVPHVTEPVP